jgi:hypothetical protein
MKDTWARIMCASWSRSRIFIKQALDLCVPRSVAILGVAGGNGLDRVDCTITKKILGLDINVRYLNAVLQRYSALPGLELYYSDLAGEPWNLPPVELVHAALVSSIRVGGAASKMRFRWLHLVVSCQSCCSSRLKTEQDVTVMRYSSMQALRDHFALIDVSKFQRMSEEKGWYLFHEEPRDMPARTLRPVATSIHRLTVDKSPLHSLTGASCPRHGRVQRRAYGKQRNRFPRCRQKSTRYG